MQGNPEGRRSLVKYTKLPIERITYRPDADEAIIGSIGRGILFLMAFWSGPSVTAFARLTEIVARLDEGGALELVVVDVDGSPALYQVPEFMGKVHGAGETAWVRDGKIVATSGLGLNTACFDAVTTGRDRGREGAVDQSSTRAVGATRDERKTRPTASGPDARPIVRRRHAFG